MTARATCASGGEFNELREAQVLINNVRWWINHGKVETAEKAIAEYWRGWAERCRTRGERAPTWGDEWMPADVARQAAQDMRESAKRKEKRP